MVYLCKYNGVDLTFQFRSNRRPNWSEFTRGGITEQVFRSDDVEKRARSINDVDPLGLTCVNDGTTCFNENEYNMSDNFLK